MPLPPFSLRFACGCRFRYIFHGYAFRSYRSFSFAFVPANRPFYARSFCTPRSGSVAHVRLLVYSPPFLHILVRRLRIFYVTLLRSGLPLDKP